jgi:predicted Abi (CAAX) family protease
MLKEPVLRGGVLYVEHEPVQVNGSEVCLARFEGPAEGDRRRIRHFSPRSGFFTGPEETVIIMSAVDRPDEVPVNTSTAEIEQSPLNAQGWYLYGKHIRGGFLVKSIEPRQVTRAWAPCAVSGAERIKQYVSHEHFDYFLKPEMARISVFEPRAELEPNVTGAGMSDYAARVWPVGSKGLLIHLFGWRKFENAPGGKGDKLSEMLDLVTGHFSFGIAEVVLDPFTREPRWDIEYKQVYGHNREEVVSGSMKWHAYMGNLQRGWMYCLPVSDTIVKIPELEPYVLGNQTVDPLNGLARELERMMALYRVGGGTGCSIIRPDLSCVQDSHCALYSGLRLFLDQVANRPEFVQGLGAPGPRNADASRFERLRRLAVDVEKLILSNGIVQANWKDFARNPLGTRHPGTVQSLINTLASLQTVFPRAAHDHLLHFAADRGYPMWNILTVQVGGKMPGVTPLKPTSLRIK